MATSDNGSKRSLTVLAVVVACFAVLWPKIFYPMIQSIIFQTEDEEIEEEVKNVNFHKMLHPQMRESMGEARPVDKVTREGSRGPFHPSLRHTAKPQMKGAGAVNLVIPVYTIAIILFFIYSLLKMVFKRYGDTCRSFHSKQQSTVCVHRCLDAEELSIKHKEISQERKTQRALEQYGKDKVLTALKTIILEMEDFRGNFSDMDFKPNIASSSLDASANCET